MAPRSNDLLERVYALNRLFDTSALSSRPVGAPEILRHYHNNSVWYTLFHSTEGAIHLALNADGVYSAAGCIRQIELVAPYLPKGHCETVLELGCGKGYNIRRLAVKRPDLHFIGVDLSKRHVRSGYRRLRNRGNASIGVGDFHDLPFTEDSFPMSFAVESLCHANDHPTVLQEIRRVTNVKGILVVIDAWRTERSLHVDSRVKQALELTEYSMAIGNCVTQREWLQVAEQAGWRLTHHQALSHEVMPSLQRFEAMAARFLSKQALASLVARALPRYVLQNAVAGYLMAESFRQGLHTYDLLVLDAY